MSGENRLQSEAITNGSSSLSESASTEPTENTVSQEPTEVSQKIDDFFKKLKSNFTEKPELRKKIIDAMDKILEADPSFKEQLNELKDTQDEEEKYKKYQKMTQRYYQKLDEEAKEKFYARLNEELEKSTQQDQKKTTEKNKDFEKIKQESEENKDPKIDDSPIIFYSEILIGKQKAYAVKRIEDTVPGFYQLLKEQKLKPGDTLTQYVDREKFKDPEFRRKAHQADKDLILASYREGIITKTPRYFNSAKPQDGSSPGVPSQHDYRHELMRGIANAKIENPACDDQDYPLHSKNFIGVIRELGAGSSQREYRNQARAIFQQLSIPIELVQKIQGLTPDQTDVLEQLEKDMAANTAFQEACNMEASELNAAMAAKKNADAEKNKAEANKKAAEPTEAKKQADDAKEVSDAEKPIEKAPVEAEKTETIPENKDTVDDASAPKDPPKPEDPVQDLADTESNQAPDPLQEAPIPAPEEENKIEEDDDEEEDGFPKNIPKSDSPDNPNDPLANDGDPESEDLDKKHNSAQSLSNNSQIPPNGRDPTNSRPMDYAVNQAKFDKNKNLDPEMAAVSAGLQKNIEEESQEPGYFATSDELLQNIKRSEAAHVPEATRNYEENLQKTAESSEENRSEGLSPT